MGTSFGGAQVSLRTGGVAIAVSDRVRKWHQELPREAFLNVAKQYIRQVANKAVELFQKQQLKGKALELE
mgnify:CR=1 FL=1